MSRVIEATNQSDLKDIQPGDQWVFTGWPDPPVDEDLEKYEKEFRKAETKYQQLTDFVKRKICDVKDA